MHIKKADWIDFDILCRNCDTIYVIDSPNDLRKEVTDNHKIRLHFICPNCGNDVVFDRMIGTYIPEEMMLQIKNMW